MRMTVFRQIGFVFLFGLTLFLTSVRPSLADPSDGACDGLAPSSGLYATCLQAYIAANRVELLTSVGASQVAIDEAQAALDEAIAKYAELGGGTIPGFEVECPCFDAADLATIPFERCLMRGDEDYLELLGGISSDRIRATVYLSPEYMACDFGSLNIEGLTSEEVDACRVLLEVEISSVPRQTECEDEREDF